MPISYKNTHTHVHTKRESHKTQTDKPHKKHKTQNTDRQQNKADHIKSEKTLSLENDQGGDLCSMME